jgi:nicotinamidase-related amidase
MQALIVVDVQNEFSPTGLRPVPNHAQALEHIWFRVQEARRLSRPIAWVIHFNKPHESRAFVPVTWGAEPSPRLGPEPGFGPEERFQKDVFGAFTATRLEEWLRSVGAKCVLIVGFYTHMCLSTSAREALVRGFDVAVDPDATGARDLEDEILGKLSADEVRRSALLHLKNMGVTMVRSEVAASTAAGSVEANSWIRSVRPRNADYEIYLPGFILDCNDPLPCQNWRLRSALLGIRTCRRRQM